MSTNCAMQWIELWKSFLPRWRNLPALQLAKLEPLMLSTNCAMQWIELCLCNRCWNIYLCSILIIMEFIIHQRIKLLYRRSNVLFIIFVSHPWFIYCVKNNSLFIYILIMVELMISNYDDIKMLQTSKCWINDTDLKMLSTPDSSL